MHWPSLGRPSSKHDPSRPLCPNLTRRVVTRKAWLLHGIATSMWQARMHPQVRGALGLAPARPARPWGEGTARPSSPPRPQPATSTSAGALAQPRGHSCVRGDPDKGGSCTGGAHAAATGGGADKESEGDGVKAERGGSLAVDRREQASNSGGPHAREQAQTFASNMGAQASQEVSPTPD